MHETWTDRLSDYLDDGLDAPGRAAVDAHLAGCAECRTVLEELRQVTLRAASLADTFPRPEVWAAVAARIGHPGADGGEEPGVISLAARRRARLIPLARWGAGIAAVLALGIAIGRGTSPGPEKLGPVVVSPESPTSPTSTSSEAAAPYRAAAVQHLARTQLLLAEFRADVQQGAADREVASWAGDLLQDTRLLLDSPAADDPRLRGLLADLELVLVQIAQLPDSRAGTEADLAAEAIDRSEVLPRLGRAVRATPINPAIQGES